MTLIYSRRCIADIELFVDTAHVVVDGGVFDVEPVSDLLFDKTFRKQFEHFKFPLGKSNFPAIN